MLIYLDTNVIVEICDGHLEHLKEYILGADSKGIKFPFSAAQIQEITKKELTSRCRDRLRLLQEISRSLYFQNSVTERGFYQRSPFQVWETINSAVDDFSISDFATSLVPFEQFKELRSVLGLNPIVLNNMGGIEAVERIDAALSEFADRESYPEVSLYGMIEQLKSICVQTFNPQWELMGWGKEHMTAGWDLGFAFKLLDCFGYWPDSEGMYEKGSGIIDVQHLFNASHCQMLVTRDKGFKNRAEAVFEILKLDIEVLSTNDFIKKFVKA